MTFILLLYALSANGQLANYLFTQENGAYAPITGGTVYGAPNVDDQRIVDPAVPLGGTVNTGPGIPLGFTFQFNGTSFQRIGINANGWISLGTDAEGVNMATSSAYTPLSSTTAITPPHLRNRIAAAGVDLIGGFAFTASGVLGATQLTGASGTAGILVGSVITGTGIPANTTVTGVSGNTVTISNALTANATNAGYMNQTGELRMQTIGTPESRVAVIQWTRFRRYNFTAANVAQELLNFQIRLYETTNVVEVIYGGMQFSNAFASTAQVGLGGSAATDFNNRTTTTNWNASTAGTTNAQGMAIASGVTYPVPGLTFRWSPNPCAVPGPVTVSNGSTSGFTASWVNTEAASYLYEVRTSGPAGSGPTGLVANGSGTAITAGFTGLNPNTTYTVHVRANCGEFQSGWTSTTFFTGYCGGSNPGPTSTTYSDILSVALPGSGTSINNTSGCPGVAGVASFLGQSATLVPGQSYTLTVNFGTCSSAYPSTGQAWIDWNQDLVFNTGESLGFHQETASGTLLGIRTFIFTVPANAVIGSTRLRVMHRESGTPPLDPCAGFTWGAVEDYTINVCLPPGATAAVSDDCGNDVFTIAVDAGAASYTVSYSIDGGPAQTTPYTGAPINIGPFADTAQVDVQVIAGPGCALDLGSFYSNCPLMVACDAIQPVMVDHCYRNNDPRIFTFVADDPEATIDLVFEQPSPIGENDYITAVSVYPDGTTSQIPLQWMGNDLSLLGTITSVTNTLRISIQSDGAGSCADSGGTDVWTMRARCSGCQEPEGDPIISTDCATYTFNVTVDLWFPGYSDISGEYLETAGIGYSVNGGPQFTLEDLVEGTYDLGDFPVGSTVNVVLLHQDGAACNKNLGNFSETIPCPPVNDDCTAAVPLTINNSGNCPQSAIGGTTLYGGLTGAMPACATTGTVADVWYSFNTGEYVMPLTLDLSMGSAGHLGYQLFSTCGTALSGTGSCVANVTGPVSIPGLAQNTEYLIRVFTRTNLGAAGSFNICFSGVHGSTLCNGALNITGLPVTNQALVCQQSNLLTAATVPVACTGATNSYKAGIEALYTYTPTVTGTYQIVINGQTWSSIFVYADACPSAGGTCVGSIGTSTSSKSLTVQLNAGTTYYIWFDSFAPPEVCPGTFSMFLDLCPAPAAVTASAITHNSADIGWTGAPGSYLIEYGPSSSFTTPGTGLTAGTGGILVPATANPHTLTSLLGSTTYRVFVRRNCTSEGNGIGSNSTAITFTTAPNPPMQPVCGSTWYDTGGALVNYANNENYVVTICPPQAGDVARVAFTSFHTEASYDRLHIYNGPTTASPMFASANTSGSGSSPYGAGGWWGNLNSNLPGPFTSSDPSGCLTFAFYSDVSTNHPGWAADITCFTPVVPACVTVPAAPANGSVGCVGATTLGWPANPDAATYEVYLDSGNGTATTLVSTQPGTSYNAGNLTVGTYSWRVVPRSAAGAAQGCTSWSFTRVPVPTVTAGNAGPVCSDQPVQLNATSSAANATWSWQGPGGFTSTTQSPLIASVTSTNAGPYTVTASVGSCNSTPSSTTVTVIPRPTGVTATAGELLVCPGDSVSLTASGTTLDVAFQESFNGAVNGWTTTNQSTGGSTGGPLASAWTLQQSPYTYSTMTFNSNAGGFQMTNSDAQGSTVTGGTASVTLTTLESPAIDLSEYSTASVSFRHYYRRWNTGDTVLVQAMSAGGAWTTLQSYTSTQGTSTAFVPANINMDAFAGQSGVKIRFRYRAAFGYYWAIDDVIVSGQRPPMFAWTSDPAGLSSTEQAPQDIVIDASTTFTVTASNSSGCYTTASVVVSIDEEGCGEACPGLPGGPGEPCDDGDPTTEDDVITAACECVGVPTGPATQQLVLEVQSDANGMDINYEILTQAGSQVMCQHQGFQPNASMSVSCSLPEGCYKLRVFDIGGDGVMAGGYVLRTAAGARIIDNRNNYTGGVSAIANDQGFCLPIGSDRTIFTSCDKLDWVGQQHLVASLNPAVTSQWNGPANASASIQDDDTGYEYWFFDPNGSYSYRRFRSHAGNDGYGTLGYDKAAHLRLNNWPAANHLPEGVLLNVRVRSVVNGTNAEWGPACRFKLDPVAAQCPMTRLLNIPGNAYYSCGSSRYWATNQAAHANPVSGASQYQFRFRLPAEGFEVIRTTPSYFARLGWTDAPGLAIGSTFEVDVRVMMNGEWCPWGDVCDFTICSPGTPPCASGSPGLLSVTGQKQHTALDIWPNPNRGDLVNIAFVSEGGGDDLDAAVELFDMYGSRVSHREVPMQDGRLNTVLDLQRKLAAGMYTVSITASGRTITQRLVVQP